MPAVRDVYVDPLLTNVSVKYKNPENAFIAEMIAPTIPVDKETGYYFVYDKSNLKRHNAQRTGLSRAKRVDYAMSKTAYGPLPELSLEIPIEYDVLNQYDNPLEPRTDATEMVTESLMIGKEADLATDMADTAIVTQNTTLSGTSQWSDFANSDPFTDIQTGIDTVKTNSLIPPNTLVLGYQVFSKLKNHPDLLERVKYSERGVLTEDILASLFNVSRVIVASAGYNTAADGQTDSLSFIWGKHAWLMYISPTPGIRQVSAFYHLTLRNGRYIDRWDEPQVKAEFVRANDRYQRKLIAAETIYLIKNAVA